MFCSQCRTKVNCSRTKLGTFRLQFSPASLRSKRSKLLIFEQHGKLAVMSLFRMNDRWSEGIGYDSIHPTFDVDKIAVFQVFMLTSLIRLFFERFLL